MAISEEQLKRLAEQLPDVSRDPQAVRQRVEAMEKVLERVFVIPGINRPVGLDSLVGLIPVVGDIATALMGAYIVWEARNLGMSKWQLSRMAANVGIDTALGAVPLAGDLFDFLWRSNTRNLKIIRKHLDKHHPGTRTIDNDPALFGTDKRT
ncbi:protein of unknown function [Parasphingorhabdus marina DSM 22363]|uniref:DUF4112 domain-containing protein n=1 Tax=Parasphingorhabdus marina DSM 22363 TaxID=1123272 RepID=A0A1N6HG29_9SPHN|nr:DUF4112 domain-containing protein [Parasphingorhabdus marina]SIO18771.1 protein of unknown function [Parasphingorhabdus marina DSM 22363]